MSIRGMAKLATWLRGGGSGESRPSDGDERLDRARTAIRMLKARVAEAEARRHKLLARLSATARDVDILRSEVVSARRETPSVGVARHTFAHRLRTLVARSNARSASGHETQLLEVSAPYRTELLRSADALDGFARRSDLDGLTWWVPARMRDARVPYRGILQTRDIAGGGVMLDLGANVGRMSIPRVVFGDVTLAYCAEPDPQTFACLVRNVIDNGLKGSVLPDQTAISDRDGTATLLRTGASESFRLVTGDVAPVSEVVEVPCCTLDTWVDRLKIDLDAVTFIKVDVEGSERRVLAGASRVLSQTHIAWQMEVKPRGLRSIGDELGDLCGDLQRVFTHFIDLNRDAVGKRVRQIAELPEALVYIEPDGKTDLLLFSTAPDVV